VTTGACTHLSRPSADIPEGRLPAAKQRAQCTERKPRPGSAPHHPSTLSHPKKKGGFQSDTPRHHAAHAAKQPYPAGCRTSPCTCGRKHTHAHAHASPFRLQGVPHEHTLSWPKGGVEHPHLPMSVCVPGCKRACFHMCVGGGARWCAASTHDRDASWVIPGGREPNRELPALAQAHTHRQRKVLPISRRQIWAPRSARRPQQQKENCGGVEAGCPAQPNTDPTAPRCPGP
jgi:hypothetical protein